MVVSQSDALTSMLIARFASGLGHGVFLAVASSVATQLAGRQRSGAAVAVVFGGPDPGSGAGRSARHLPGQHVELAGHLHGRGGEWYYRIHRLASPDADERDDGSMQANAMDGLNAMFNPRLLAGAGITVLAYAGSFTLYTYISPFLLQVTRISESKSSLLMLGYGVMAAIGNVWGGRLADRRGADFAVMIVLTGLTTVLLLIWFSASSLPLMVLLTGLLGARPMRRVPACKHG